jgi:hypothetical protein
MIITDQDIIAAQTEADTAAGELAELERHLPTHGTVAEAVSLELAVAMTRSRQAEIRLAALTAERDQQAAGLAARTAREKAAVGLGRLQSDLEDSRSALVAAVASAVDSLLAVADATTEHDQLVERARVQLGGLGLKVSDVDSQAGHETAAGERTGSGLRLRGRAWQSVDPSLILCYTLRETLQAVAGVNAPAVVRLSFVGDLQKRLDALLSGLTPPAPRAQPVRVRPARSRNRGRRPAPPRSC